MLEAAEFAPVRARSGGTSGWASGSPGANPVRAGGGPSTSSPSATLAGALEAGAANPVSFADRRQLSAWRSEPCVQPGAPDPQRHRRRIWRHRHEPVVRAARVFSRHSRRRGNARERARRAVAHLLVAHTHHLDQIHPLRHASRQQRRKGHSRALGLVAQSPGAQRRSRASLVALGLFGAALLYGDGMITPAISVLGAVEGLDVATHIFEPYIVPITLVILVGLFMIQSRGTARVGLLFGPVML